MKDISEADAVAEGVAGCDDGANCKTIEAIGHCMCGGAVGAYADLWAKLHGPESHKANPWVIATSFTVHQCNIDAANAPKGE